MDGLQMYATAGRDVDAIDYMPEHLVDIATGNPAGAIRPRYDLGEVAGFDEGPDMLDMLTPEMLGFALGDVASLGMSDEMMEAICESPDPNTMGPDGRFHPTSGHGGFDALIEWLVD